MTDTDLASDDTLTPEQRAADQDAAMEAAFVAGTLPEEDRRAPAVETPLTEEPPAPPPPGGEVGVSTSVAYSADEVSDHVVAAFFALQDSLPAGSRIERQHGLINVYFGPGVSSHGVGKTFSRALLAKDSTWGHDETGRRAEFTAGGDLLPPESSTVLPTE